MDWWPLNCLDSTFIGKYMDLCFWLLAGIAGQHVGTSHIVPGVGNKLDTVLLLGLGNLWLACLPGRVGGAVHRATLVLAGCLCEGRSVGEGVGSLSSSGDMRCLKVISPVVQS